MDINMRCCCLLAILLTAFHVAVRADEPTRRADTEIETSTPQPPPVLFPTGKNLEVPGLLEGTAEPPETETVEHRNVKDPGKTHEQGGEVPKVGSHNDTALENKTSTDSNSTEAENVTSTNSTKEILKTSVIYTCNFPKSWLNHARNGSSSFNGWMDNGENDTDICSFPPDWMDNGENDTLHICTISKEWLRANNYTIQNGTIPKELLMETETNTSNIRCVTPREALEGDHDDTDTSHFSTILPRAWLKEGNDIYIYIIPYENGTETGDEEHTTLSEESTSTEDVPTSPPSSGAEITTVNVTSDATTVRVFANNTAEESNTSLPVSTTNQTTLRASTESTSPTPKINTPAEDSSKNKTVRDKEETTTSSSAADDAENIVGHSGSTTPSSPSALLQTHADHVHISTTGKTAFLQPTESAAILAGVFVGIAILGYVGLLVWRRLLERRYGHREMLVNEDDDFDTSDMRHFEMQNTRTSSSVVF